jgi:o-succinylbenzoate synthase
MKLSITRFSGSTPGAENSLMQWPSRCGLLLELHAGSDRGLGEASPLPGYSSDTLEGAATALGSLDLGQLERSVSVENTGEALESVANLLPRGQCAARMALESAVLDLRGHQRDTSAPALLGAEPGAARALAWLVGAPNAGTLQTVRLAQQAGYDHFKIKLGKVGSREQEIASVCELRQALGAGPRLRLDANRAWSEAEAGLACKLLQTLDIEFIEEPCRTFTRPLGAQIPIALDESLQGIDAEDLGAHVKYCGAGIIVLKPMILGGLSRCLQLGTRAAALGLGVVVSHSFDGPVALAAAAALALALPTRFAQGLAPHAALDAWPQHPLPISQAVLRSWSTPGLGLDAMRFR